MKTFIILVLIMFQFAISDAQVGIGTDSPQSTLDIRGENHLGSIGENDGILVPRVTDLAVNGLTGGQLVFLTVNWIDNNGTLGNTADDINYASGFHYWNPSSTNWTPIDTTIEPWNRGGTTNPARSNTDNIYTLGQVGIGTTNPQGALHINTENSRDILFLRFIDNLNDDLDIDLFRSRGSIASPSLLLDNTRLGGLRGQALTVPGSYTFNPSAEIYFQTEGASSSTSSAGEINFATTPVGSISTAERMTIKSDGRVGIGITEPDNSSILDLSSSNKGFIAPRVSLNNVTNSMSDGTNTNANGLMIYNTNNSVVNGFGTGYYYWNGSVWTAMKASNEVDGKWSRSGDVLTGSDFLGSTNNQPLIFKIENQTVGNLSLTNSLSFGRSSVSTGLRASAYGFESSATGSESTAIGRNSGASGDRSTAVGFESRAQASEASAFGRGAIASAARSTAIGFESTATSNDATAIGRNADASASQSSALGFNAIASGNDAIALGSTSQATNSNSTALGRDARATNSNSTAIGNGSRANANNATAIGNGAVASLANSIVLGNTSAGNETRVGIGTSSPNSSSILDLTSTNKGFLTPRLNLLDALDTSTIPSPATGLMVFNTVSSGNFPNNLLVGFHYYDGSRWRNITDTPINRTVKYRNNNTSTNFYVDGVNVDIFNSLQWNEDTSIFQKVNNTDLRILEPGYYEVTVNLGLTVDAIELYFYLALRLNNTDSPERVHVIGPEDGGGQENLSVNFTQTLFINRNDILRLRSYKENSDNDNVNFRANQSSSITVKKLR